MYTMNHFIRSIQWMYHIRINMHFTSSAILHQLCNRWQKQLYFNHIQTSLSCRKFEQFWFSCQIVFFFFHMEYRIIVIIVMSVNDIFRQYTLHTSMVLPVSNILKQVLFLRSILTSLYNLSIICHLDFVAVVPH